EFSSVLTRHIVSQRVRALAVPSGSRTARPPDPVEEDGAMHVLIAPEGFEGVVAAPAVAAALADGWASGAPHDTVDVCPLSDGGPGLAQLVARSVPARLDDAGLALVTSVNGTTTAYVDARP